MPSLMELAGKKKTRLVVSCTLHIIASVASVVPFYIIYLLLELLFDSAADISRSWYLLALLFVFYVVMAITLIVAYDLSHRAAYEILYDVRVMLGEKLVKLPVSYFNEKNTGELKTVMNENVEKLELFLAHHLPEMITTAFVPIFLAGFLLVIDWRMALASILPVVLAVAVILVYGRMGWGTLVREYVSAQTSSNSAILEYVQGIKVIRAFNRARESFKGYAHNMASWRDTMIRLSEERALPFTLYQALITSTLLAIIPVGLWLYSNGSILSGTFLLFIIVGPLFGGLFMRIYDFLRYYIEEKECLDRINKVLLAPEMKETKGTAIPTQYSITFKNVTHSYDKNIALRDVSFFIPAKTRCALVGSSGAGKTTVANLIARFWDTEKGEVLIGDVNVKDILPDKLLSLISIVFQDTFLFNNTVLENIKIAKPDATKETIINAAKAAQCHDFIERLPQGYDTIIGEKGAKLSGGEKQRIAIARAILKNAPILILDEAIVFIDPNNERLMQVGIGHLTAGKTVLVITHKLSSVVNAEQILVMDNGIIMERGRHVDLVKSEGFYCRMWKDYVAAREWRLKSHV